MFSLIITIISIALVAALALATIYYGGTAFNKGSAEAKASQLINEGQQINGAKAMMAADTAAGTVGTKTFNPDYLAQSPAGWTIPATATGTATVTASSADVCQAVNAKAGLKATGTADAGDTDTALVVVAGDLANFVYGCVTASSEVSYKF